MRTHITIDPYTDLYKEKMWIDRGHWPCKWISCADVGAPPFVTAYRKRFSLDHDSQIRAHVTADERYELFLDGERIGRGSERGDRENWYYETYDLTIPAGEHVIVARVWSLGGVGAFFDDRISAPYAQMSVRPGFLFSPEGEFIGLLGTGVAEWEAKKLGGYSFTDPLPGWGTGANLDIDGAAFSWGFERGEGDGWGPVETLLEGTDGFTRNEYGAMHMLKPATLQQPIDREVPPGSVIHIDELPHKETREIAIKKCNNLAGHLGYAGAMKGEGEYEIPANALVRAIIDLGNYYCAYPELTVSGGKGSEVRILWAESLYENIETGTKGNRGEIEGKYFQGIGDTFRPDGGRMRRFDTLWWQAGRYIEVMVHTGEEPLTIESLRLRETRYPLEMESVFESSDARLAEITPIMLRGLQMCMHETYMDCPYYEQLMYIGDTRLQVLTTYAITRDDRMPRKALRMFDASRLNSGITMSRYPSRVTQIIPTFSLWHIGMIHDYALWRNDQGFVRELMPGARGLVDWYLDFVNADGLVEAPNGWNFVDWVPQWTWGLPSGAEGGVNGFVNWQFIWALSTMAQLEDTLGEPELAARMRRLASELTERVTAKFWDESRGLFAEDFAHEHFSEQTQCMAILSEQLDATKLKRVGKALVEDPKLYRSTIFFLHYLFEAYRVIGRVDKLFERMDLWFTLKALDFKTPIETPEPSRSDCHAWGAHPMYHFFATILGIRPTSPGFATVRIEPQLGVLTEARGTLVHPLGEISVDIKVVDGVMDWTVVLPDGVTGVFVGDGETVELG